ncbi:pre-mRNA-splicing factor Rse1p [[Candida] railenensis]|uniref:Pre-mRNA-splicing factor Rse1p n=1 Tax=[Candida] railenensis TaxID=45579 RepID=A0A9P0QNZ4_9ASCO|nr:pre-mRNA-splicing factor Rse1p [[Candida] railenensis]
MEDSLFLYQLTLRRPSHTSNVVVGQFTPNKKVQELIFANGTNIEMYRPNQSSGKLHKICQQDTWGEVQGLDIYRLSGSSEDLLVVTSDSGKLTFLKFDIVHSLFYPVLSEPHSKTGFRRTTPGDYLAIDPQNRAIMISAIERNKLVYKVSSSDQSSLIQVSAPLEANSRKHITFGLIALDTGFENPIFASIECNYGIYENSSKDVDAELLLVYYEFDQALNHIVRRKSKVSIPGTSSKLIAVPNSAGGGVMICSESMLTYEAKDGDRKYIQIPRRNGESTSAQILSFVVHKMKKKKFFILLQSNLGDLFKLTFQYNEEEESMESINLTYFDTIPVCHSLSILKAGFLLANVANSNKLYYQFENLGEDVDDSTSRETDEISEVISRYEVRKDENLANLSLVDSIETLNPIIGSTLIDSTKQIVTLSSNSYLKTLTHGLPTSIVVSSPLPMHPTSIYTSKLESDSKNDDYLVLSSTLSSTTLVLSIGEVVEEVSDSHFIANQPTISVQQIGKSSIIQIYPNGIRHVNSKSKETTDWYPPAGISITSASSNNEQVIVALSNREICYFEVDPTDNQLIEYQDRLEMSGGIITSVALSANKQLDSVKCSFAVVGCADSTISVISLQPHNCLEIITLQALSSNCTSMIILSGSELHIGMENGLYARSRIDSRTGNLSDTRTRYLGNKPVELSTIKLSDAGNGSGDEESITGVLAISSKSWIGYNYHNNFKLTPLLNVNINSGASFFSEDIGGDAIVAINKQDELVIFTLGDGESNVSMDEDFSISSMKLRYTPKRMVREEEAGSDQILYVIGSQLGVESNIPATRLEVGKTIESEIEVEDIDPTPTPGCWSSCLQIVDVFEQKVIQSIEFSTNERALAVAIVMFSDSNKSLVIGTSAEGKYYLYVFKLAKSLHFLHKTEVDFPPNVLLGFQGKLLVGMSNYLRLYDLGQRQLLRKASTLIDQMKNIVSISLQGKDGRLVVGDIASSVSFVKFDVLENKFFPFADDILRRQITTISKLDYNTVVGGDKLGNVFVSRVTSSLSKRVDEDWSVMKYQPSYLNGSASRFQNICEYHLGDIPTSFVNGCLNIGGVDSIIYTGLQGSLGLLLPFATKQEIDFFTKLQFELREFFDYNFDEINIKGGDSNILSRDHKKFRSYYNPARNVVDGDLIERFVGIPQAIKVKISNKLDGSPQEVERKIAELRNRSAF